MEIAEPFADRRDAGRRLARALEHYADCKAALILGIPRGGVIVGLEISRHLRLPLDVLITRKLGAPGNPELAIGALAETGYLYRNTALLSAYPTLGSELEQERRAQEQEIVRRRAVYRGGRPLPSVLGRTIILVDDGVATGATYLASIAALRAAQAGRVVAALPIAPSDTAEAIGSLVDECVILASPSHFYAVGQGYRDFRQLTDEEVLEALRQAWPSGTAREDASGATT